MKYIYLTGLLWLLFTSCSDFLKEYSLDQAYVRGYSDLDELLIGETYMATEYYDMNLDKVYYPYIHMMADETQENTKSVNWQTNYSLFQKQFFGYITWQYRIGLNPDKLTTKAEDTDWNKLYKHINTANMILSEIDKQSAETDEDKQAVARIRGEAYFLRAAYYFTLVNLYGQPYQPANAATALGVPVKTSPVIEDKMFPRESLETVYSLIIQDLEQAATNLEGIARKSIYRTNLTAVRLLQSRVYLYMQNWAEAAKYAQLCLDLQSDLIDLNTFDGSKAFAEASSPETIFSMGGNGIQAIITTAQKGLSASEDLKACYKEGDLRKEHFVCNNEENWSDLYWYCNKYVRKENQYTANVSDNFLFRTAEAWLNLAEAYACMGGNNETAAREALDHLREHRLEMNSFDATTLSGEDLIEEIRTERRRELCFEGHRWFDLRRYTVSEKKPFTGAIRNTYTEWGDWNTPSTMYTYELKAGDPSWTLQIPYEVIQFEELTPNPRNERTHISINQFYL